MPQTLKKPDAEAAVEKELEIGENTGMVADKGQKQKKKGERRSKEKGQKCSCRVIDGSLSSHEFGLRASISKV